jgi:hypothetical protein
MTNDFGANITGFGTVSTPNLIAKPLINSGHISGDSASQKITLPGYVKGVGTFNNVSFTGTYSPGLSPTIVTAGSLAFSPGRRAECHDPRTGQLRSVVPRVITAGSPPISRVTAKTRLGYFVIDCSIRRRYSTALPLPTTSWPRLLTNESRSVCDFLGLYLHLAHLAG